MAEILTESFCERCGTRYTFEATRPRRRGVGRIRTLTRGVKNFVVNDSSSFAEAMAAAREDDERIASTRQLDAFQRTFNFCMGCRQYTCRNCWNSSVGECLSCAPDPSLAVLPAAIPDLALVRPRVPAATPPEPDHANVVALAWPISDLPSGREPAAVVGLPTTPVEATPVEAEIELTSEELTAIQGALARRVDRRDESPTVTPVEAGQRRGVKPAEPPVATGGPAEVPRTGIEAATAAAAPSAASEPVAGGRAETRRLLSRFRPRPDRATGFATPTASMSPGERAPAAQDPFVAGPAAELEVPIAAPEPRAASAAPEPRATDASPQPAPAATPTAPPADHAVQPTWRMVAPENGSPVEPEPVPAVWPTPGTVTRRSADAIPSSPWAARVATARSLESPVWAASSRDILAAEAPDAAGPVGIQSCVSCGLSLSANARFCRRCGSRQG
jgi:hypothetical protein